MSASQDKANPPVADGGRSLGSKRRRAARTHATNVVTAVQAGFYAAAFLALWTGLLRLVAGEAPFAEHGLTYTRVAAGYLLGGLAGGAVVGALLPVARSRGGTAAVGALAGLAVGAAMSVVASGMPPWRDPRGGDIALVTVALGAAIGLWFPALARRAAANSADGPP